MRDPVVSNQVFWSQRDGVPPGRACLFLDRDGVLIEEVAYLHRPSDVRIAAGAAALIGAARARGLLVGIVTNQSGIGRGRFGWEDFAAVQAEIVRQLNCGPAPFDFVAACGTHPEATIPDLRIAHHPWRKPQPGMLQMAAAAFSIDLAGSLLVGDHVTDLQAGLAAAVGRLIHVLTGHGALHRPAAQRLAAGRGAGALLLLDDLGAVPPALGWTDEG